MKKHNFHEGHIFCAFLLISLIVLGSTNISLAQEPMVIRYGGPMPMDHPISKGQLAFKKYAEELSNGRLKVEVYVANQLGSSGKQTGDVRSGIQTMTVTSTANVSRMAPLTELLGLPFLFATREKAWKFFEGTIGTEMANELEKAGFKHLAWGELGFRHLSNSKRPVRSPRDMQGLKIRLQGIPLEMKAFQAMGANTVTLDWAELYSALQQGVVDGTEQTYSIFESMKFYEVQKYLTDFGHTFQLDTTCMNKKFFDSLPADLQRVVLEAARRSKEIQNQLTDEDNSRAAKSLESRMQVIHITSKEHDEFFQAMKPAYDFAREKFGKEVVERIIREARK